MKYLKEQLLPHSEINLDYTIKPATALTPDKYMLVVRVFYQDEQYEYSNVVLNKPIVIRLPPGSFPILGLGTALAIAAGMCVGLYFLINWFVNKYYAGNKKKPFDLLDFVKGLLRKDQ